MKTIYIALSFLTFTLISQTGFSETIAIAPIKSFGLTTSGRTITKLTRWEFIKINKYKVLDEFDIQEISNYEKYDTCFAKNCLVEYGKELKVDYIVSGNIDGLGNKIVINFKIIDVKQNTTIKNKSMEFDNQENELQRMIGIVIQEMHNITPDPVLVKSLEFNNEMIVSNNISKVDNSGPRMGIAYTTGTLNEFLVRPYNQGGLDIAPVITNIGYQFEGQYVGTENFAALVECLFMFSGLEQGKFIPSFSLLNGFRFGQSGWEFAFGPSFGLTKTSRGFFDTGGHFGEENKYWSSNDFYLEGYNESSLSEFNYYFSEHLDRRGDLQLTTRWITAFGRTFKSGSLNIPVNVFYSSQKKGGMLGLSVGFNVVRSKQSIKTYN